MLFVFKVVVAKIAIFSFTETVIIIARDYYVVEQTDVEQGCRLAQGSGLVDVAPARQGAP